MREASNEREFERRTIVAALSWLCDPLRTMENFQKGDTVQLKSGGPIMSVGSAIPSNGKLNCDWFAGSELKHGVFHPEQLKKAELREPDEPQGPFSTQSY